VLPIKVTAIQFNSDFKPLPPNVEMIRYVDDEPYNTRSYTKYYYTDPVGKMKIELWNKAWIVTWPDNIVQIFSPNEFQKTFKKI
jgi:hypothetical protein